MTRFGHSDHRRAQFAGAKLAPSSFLPVGAQMFEQQSDQLAALQVLSDELGFFEAIDAQHHAFHVTGGDTLLVTFESGAKLWGPDVATAIDASLLMIHADGPTWF